jgi:hypothetical protein
VPWNKLRRSTNFIIFGPTDQKLSVFENLRRSMGRAASGGTNQQELTTSAQKGGQ